MRGNVLETTTAEDYLEAAKEAAAYIDTRRIDTPHGLVWSMEDAVVGDEEYYDEICLYAGSAGIAHFYLLMWRYTGEGKYLEDAKAAAAYIIYRWNEKRDLRKNFSKWAYSTGYAGAAFFLLELLEITGDRKLRDAVTEIVEAILADAKPAAGGAGYGWGDYTSIVGDAGTILFLLHAAEKLGVERWREFAFAAGEGYLGKSQPYEGGGIFYPSFNHEYEAGAEDIDPNFPMGTAGIGFTLLRLYEESGDERFLAAVEGIEEFHEAAALKTGDAALLAHALVQRPDLYYLGYCHGPAGTARFYRKYYQVTGNPRYLDWEKRLVNGVLRAGAPEVRSNGYWYIHCYCCGTAGLTDLFTGLWAATGSKEALGYAERTARQLMGWRSRAAQNGKMLSKWNQAFVRVQPSRITANIGLYDGAAGIGLALMQVYGALTGNFRVERTLDDPYPSAAEGL